jgi:hypothetical protein
MNISDLIPQKIKDFANAVLDLADRLLKGETARAIGYGGGALLYVVARFTVLPDVSFADAIAQGLVAEGVVAAFIEPIRHYVSSPATVADLQGQLDEEIAAHHSDEGIG